MRAPRSLLPLLACAALALAGTGCAVLGPASVRNGRAAYNEAIVTTNNEQVLGMIVRMRYGEPSGMLAVASVTANLRLQGTIGAEFGVGSESNYAGNLTPLSAGIAYEENPTIAYTPVQGEKYLRQLLSPLPLDLVVLLLNALGDGRHAATLLLRSLNGVRNPDFLGDAAGGAPDPRFAQALALLGELRRRGAATWTHDTETPAFALVVDAGDAEGLRQLGALCALLGTTRPRPVDGVVTLPVRSGTGRPATPALLVETRSLWDLFQIAAAGVEVPAAHLASGIAAPIPPVGAAGAGIRIASARRCPRTALIAVSHHGYCFAVDAADARSKLTFRILEALMSVRMAESIDAKAAPVLTVPVSR